jgi:hypothetical protein
MKLSSNGRLGLGITAPNKQLHIYNTSSNAEINIQSVAGAGNHWGLYNDISNNSFRLWGGADHLTVLRDGRVGIGTTNPKQNLTVSGSSNSEGIGIGPNGGVVWPVLSRNGTDGGLLIKSYNDSNQVYTTNVAITSGGSVGIGTTNPGSYKLYVNGDTNINGTLTATSFVGPVTGTLSAANVSSGEFGANTSGGNYVFAVSNPLGRVGIGVSNPAAKFHIEGPSGAATDELLRLSKAGGYGTTTFSQYYVSSLNWGLIIGNTTNGNTPIALNHYSGNVGIGTTAPEYRLDVSGAGKINNIVFGSASATGYYNIHTYSSGPEFRFFGTGNSYASLGISRASVGASYGSIASPSNGLIVEGNVGIGTTDPGVYRLKVAGDVAITGTLQTQTGSDFAEEFSVLSDLEAGTVVTMAEEGYKSVRAANKAYDSQVVGIVSDNPSIIAGRVESEKKVVVAMMGVVSVKVSDINGEVRKGDLLTSSSISGYAMKAVDYRPGTIIGKALEDLTGKSGSIKVLVNLQ